VIGGIEAAASAGLRVKINMVALRAFNEDEFEPMLRWCAKRGFDLTLIETMPLGEIEEDRTAHYLPLDEVRGRLAQVFDLRRSAATTGGPARYYEVDRLGIRIGFITPLTENFCDGCNRIRIAATGTVFGCLGHDQNVELRELLRGGDRATVSAALDALLAGKARRHEFRIAAAEPAVRRHMSVTGG
jgi:cyclic pyranopterin phosphate synthase